MFQGESHADRGLPERQFHLFGLLANRTLGQFDRERQTDCEIGTQSHGSHADSRTAEAETERCKRKRCGV